MNTIERDIQEVKSILEAELQKPESLSQAGIVRRYMPIILEYLEQGLTWEVVLRALNTKGITLNLRTFQQTVYRLKKNKIIKLEPISTSAAPLALADGGEIAEKSSSPVVVPATIGGWEFENQDNLIPPDLLKRAFVEIDGITYDIRKPRPAEFGDERDSVRDKVNPSSPNWAEYKARDDKRGVFARRQLSWRTHFKKWLVEQGYSGTQA